jgi:hypothetical protein
MNAEQREKYEEFFIWLITPKDDKEQQLFKEKQLVDDYIEIINDIPHKTDEQLLDSIDIQLSGYGKSIDRDNL